MHWSTNGKTNPATGGQLGRRTDYLSVVRAQSLSRRSTHRPLKAEVSVCRDRHRVTKLLLIDERDQCEMRYQAAGTSRMRQSGSRHRSTRRRMHEAGCDASMCCVKLSMRLLFATAITNNFESPGRFTAGYYADATLQARGTLNGRWQRECYADYWPTHDPWGIVRRGTQLVG